MLSRVAENIYWMARHIERAENTARLIKVNTFLLLDLPKRIAPGWVPLLIITGAEELFHKRYKDTGERQVTKFLIADSDNPGAILPSLLAARENCRTIRDIVPREVWELINELYLQSRDNLNQGLTKNGRHSYLNRVITSSQTLAGLLAGTMNHDVDYHFMCIGRSLERADMTSRIIDVRSADMLPDQTGESKAYDNIQWMGILKSLTAYQMYRRSMQVRIHRNPVLRFLFQSQEFPRSVLHCIQEVENRVKQIGTDRATLQVLEHIKINLLDVDIKNLDHASLHTYVDNLQLDLIRLHNFLAQAYFLPVEE
ncbi:hypothetical protein TI04_03865 [Achromatium sp. WMS2]|nr:hypothetical protein TI04_03865 [Achromatium sp. WMS2]